MPSEQEKSCPSSSFQNHYVWAYMLLAQLRRSYDQTEAEMMNLDYLCCSYFTIQMFWTPITNYSVVIVAFFLTSGNYPKARNRKGTGHHVTEHWGVILFLKHTEQSHEESIEQPPTINPKHPQRADFSKSLLAWFIICASLCSQETTDIWQTSGLISLYFKLLF